MAKHPMQPVILDDEGVVRFKKNTLVEHILEESKLSLNWLYVEGFPKEDYTQLMQLLGYSVSGFGDLAEGGCVEKQVFKRAYRAEQKVLARR